jgi:hypothetical protein
LSKDHPFGGSELKMAAQNKKKTTPDGMQNAIFSYFCGSISAFSIILDTESGKFNDKSGDKRQKLMLCVTSVRAKSRAEDQGVGCLLLFRFKALQSLSVE